MKNLSTNYRCAAVNTLDILFRHDVQPYTKRINIVRSFYWSYFSFKILKFDNTDEYNFPILEFLRMAGIVEDAECTAGQLHKVVMDLYILLGVLMYLQKISNFYFASTQQCKVDFYFCGSDLSQMQKQFFETFLGVPVKATGAEIVDALKNVRLHIKYYSYKKQVADIKSINQRFSKKSEYFEKALPHLISSREKVASLHSLYNFKSTFNEADYINDVKNKDDPSSVYLYFCNCFGDISHKPYYLKDKEVFSGLTWEQLEKGETDICNISSQAYALFDAETYIAEVNKPLNYFNHDDNFNSSSDL